MSAWTIYWILQLDSIGAAIGNIAFGLTVAAIIITVWNGVSHMDTRSFPSLRDPEARAAACASRAKLRNRLAAAAIPVVLLSGMIPSTKTAAAMVIVPAIANNETIRKESGELYDLAKQALRDAVTDKAKEATKEAAK